jgi:predicted permease
MAYGLSSIGRDLAHAVRALAKDRIFTVVCVISLGIGMGAVVALATFGRALAAPAHGITTNGLTELLVIPEGPLRAKAGTWALEKWSYPDYQALRHADTGMSLAGWTMEFSQVGSATPDGKQPPRVATLYVSADYFDVFGVTLARGPGFDPAIDDAPSGAPRVVLSYEFWQRRMNGDPNAVGTSLTINGVAHTVVGIAPPDFLGHFHFFKSPNSPLFVPLEQHPRLRANPNLRTDRSVDWVHIHGRLNPGVDMTRASGLVSATVSGLAKRYPATNEYKAATVEPYYSLGAVGHPESRRVLATLLGLAGAVLFIVCLNISGMMLVRGARRERELCIRAALGAGRRRLIQHLFFEAVLLAVAGGALSGFVLFGIPAIAGWWIGAPVPREVDFDVVEALLSTGLCLAVSVLFGMLPAVRFSRPDLVRGMKDDAGGGGRQTIRVHRVAAILQIGVAVPFLVISGVMRNRVRTADFGFPTDGLAAARVRVPIDAEQSTGFVRNIRDSLKEANGVRSVAVADGMPIDFDYRLFRVGSPHGEHFATSQVTHVDENFLATIGARMLRGRTITLRDRLADARVAVISQPLADLLFPGAEPIGEEVTITLDDAREEKVTVIGVSADFATSQLTTERPQMLLPLSGKPASPVYFIARGAAGSEPTLKGALENVLRDARVDALSGEVFSGIVIGHDLVEKSIADLISESIAVAVAGGIVLILAALGIVGVVGFMAATRTREIAVRMALGSTRLRVFGLMLSDVVKLVIPGVAGGLFLATVLIRTMDNVMGTPLTLGPTPLGAMVPVIYAGASAVAIGVALLAGLPAERRATSIPPMAAIRAE